jgi:hypothetical protein
MIGGAFNSYSTSGRTTMVMNGGASGAILEMALSNVSCGYMYHNGTDMYLWQSRSGILGFATNNTQKFAIDSAGAFSGAGNITGGNIIGTTAVSATGNVTGGNLRTAGQISATGNITGGNVLGGANVNATTHTGTTVSVTGNITGGNVLTGGLISATGNITGGNLITGAGSGGNITGANVISANTVTVTANVTGGNVLTGGLISATGNITGGNLLISGSISDSAQLDINTTAGNANIVLTPNGTGNVNISANIMPTANATANIGSATLSFNTVFAKATSAQYADLAEMYEADAAYAPGTVLEFGGDKEVTISNTPFSPLIVGVVSTNPAYLMNSAAQGKYMAAIALVGRVPTRVIGPVSKGAMMISAGDGRAKACTAPAMGTVIGKALQDHPGGPGMIEIVVGRL